MSLKSRIEKAERETYKLLKREKEIRRVKNFLKINLGTENLEDDFPSLCVIEQNGFRDCLLVLKIFQRKGNGEREELVEYQRELDGSLDTWQVKNGQKYSLSGFKEEINKNHKRT